MDHLGSEDLTALARGAVAGQEGARHLEECGACRARLEQARQAHADTVQRPGDPTLPSPQQPAPPGELPRGAPVGRYLAIEKLGGGGMGTVYLAYDPELDRRVALKLVRPDLAGAGGEHFRSRLVREAQAMARLTHPNVVAVYDAGAFEDQLFVAMEYVEGADLARWLAERPRTWREVLDAFLQAGRGLAAAHAAGLVHRDFKPHNVMVARDGTAKVTDFGLARFEGAPGSPDAAPTAAPIALTTPGELLGTPAYMAPEQFLGQPTDARTDQFNFCAALYESLYGHRAFPGTTLESIREAVTRGGPEPAPRDNDVPGWLREHLIRGLQRDPARRFASLDALLAALTRDPSRVRRRRAALAAGLLALLGGSVGVGRWVYLDRTACDRAAGRAFATRWNPGVAHSVAAAGKESASAVARLEHLFGSWRTARLHLCEDERAHRLPPVTAQVRSQCLDDYAGRLTGLAEALAEGGPAQRKIRSLLADEGEPTYCATLNPLTEPALTEPDPDVDRAWLEIQVEDDDGASRLLAAAEARALARHDTWRVAHIHNLRGMALIDEQRQLEQAMEEERTCAQLALAAGDDDEASGCRVAVVQVLGQLMNRYDDALAAAKEARAQIDRAGKGTRWDAELDRVLGNIAVSRGDPQGVALLERAATKSAALFGPDATDVAWCDNDLGRAVAELEDDAPRAAELFQRAAQIIATRRGPDDPGLATMLENAGSAQLLADQPARALPLLDRALRVAEGHVDSMADDLADILAVRALALVALGRVAEASADLDRSSQLLLAQDADSTTAANAELGRALIALSTGPGAAVLPHAEKAVAAAEERPGEADTLSQARFALARALPDSERSRARALAAQSLVSFEAHARAPASKRRAAQVRAWLAAHP